jgi:hypothetical protein
VASTKKQNRKEADSNAQMLAQAYKEGIRAIVFYDDVIVGYSTLVKAEKYAAKAQKKGKEAQAYAIDKNGYIRVHHCPACSTTCPRCGEVNYSKEKK